MFFLSLSIFIHKHKLTLRCNADLNAGVGNILSHSNNQQVTQKAHKPTMKLRTTHILPMGHIHTYTHTNST